MALVPRRAAWYSLQCASVLYLGICFIHFKSTYIADMLIVYHK